MKFSLLPAFLAFGIVVATGAFTQVRADQPHMQSALADLRAARQELDQARHDKGGNRTLAIQKIDEAIAAVKNGMADAN